MKTKWICMQLVLLFILSFSVFCFADDDEEKVEHDRAIVSVFVQPGMSFLGFDDRDKFQTATDSIFKDLREEARTHEESLAVSRQTFQKVNMAFPITAGIQIQTFEDHFISAGVGFIYDNEEIVLTDRLNKTHSYNYTLQAIPLYLEYRLAISNSFMSISGESLFSIAARWYWMLPGTEIYSTWGRLKAKSDPLGCGFGLSLGYLIGSWKNFKIYGDLGFSSISLESNDSFAKIVPLYDEPDKETGKSEADRKAKWDIGGLQLQIRVSFGVWNKPELKEELPADTAKVKPLQEVPEKQAREDVPEKSIESPSENAVFESPTSESSVTAVSENPASESSTAAEPETQASEQSTAAEPETAEVPLKEPAKTPVQAPAQEQ